MYQFIKYEKEERIAWIILNRPQVMNALNPAMLAEMRGAILEAAQDNDVGAIALTGEGRAFCAGLDLAALSEQRIENGRIKSDLDQPANDLIETIRTIPKVVIAAVNGYCITGGLELLLCCDLIVASEEAKFADTHARRGLRPSWGMSQRLPRTVGWLKAKELSFTADMINAREAERIGLVNFTVPADKLKESVIELARKIIANSPGVIAAYKVLYNRGMMDTLEKGLEMEANTGFEIKDTDERLAPFRKKK